MIITFFLITVVAFGAFLLIQSVAPKTQSVTQESAKSLLLKISQIVGVLASFGLAAQLPFLDQLQEALTFINLNIDTGWQLAAALIEIVIGLAAIFIPSLRSAEARIQSSRQL